MPCWTHHEAPYDADMPCGLPEKHVEEERMRPSYRYRLRAVTLVLLSLSVLLTSRVHAQSVTASPTAGSTGGQINVTYSGPGSPQCANAPFLVLLRSGRASSLLAQGATDSS